MTLGLASLRAAYLAVPEGDYPELLAAWRSELWYAWWRGGRRAIGCALRAFQDAWPIRQYGQPRRILHGQASLALAAIAAGAGL